MLKLSVILVLHKINMGGDVSVNVKLSQVINLMPC